MRRTTERSFIFIVLPLPPLHKHTRKNIISILWCGIAYLHRVFNLKQMPIGRKDGNSTIVGHGGRWSSLCFDLCRVECSIRWGDVTHSLPLIPTGLNGKMTTGSDHPHCFCSTIRYIELSTTIFFYHASYSRWFPLPFALCALFSLCPTIQGRETQIVVDQQEVFSLNFPLLVEKGNQWQQIDNFIVYIDSGGVNLPFLGLTFEHFSF